MLEVATRTVLLLTAALTLGFAIPQSAQAGVTALHSFCLQSGCADGANPSAGLVQGTDGNFYGTTYSGGTSGQGHGTVFQITPSGTLKTLYTFCLQASCADGAFPYAGLVQGTDGSFYGTTLTGGTNNNGGTVFKISSTGSFATLYDFCGQANCADGRVLMRASSRGPMGTCMVRLRLAEQTVEGQLSHSLPAVR